MSGARGAVRIGDAARDAAAGARALLPAAMAASALVAATLAGMDTALASSDTTFSGPLDTVEGTRVVLASPDRDTAQWSADSLGRSEVEEVAEGFSYGANTIRDGVSLTPKRELRALALASEIMRLENLSGYLRFPGPLPVATIRLDYVDRPEAAARFVPRDGVGDEAPDAGPPQALPKPDAGPSGPAASMDAEMPDPQGALDLGPPPGEPEFWPPPVDDTAFNGARKEPAVPEAGPPPPAGDTDAGATEDREDKAAVRRGTQEDDGAGSRPGVAI